MSRKMQKATMVVGGLFVSLVMFGQGCFAQVAKIPEYREPGPIVDTEEYYKKEPPYIIGFSEITLGNTWRTQGMAEAKYEARKHSKLIKDFYVTNAGGNVSEQISDIEDLLARGVDALCIQPGSLTALNPIIERVYQMGIPVVLGGPVTMDKFSSMVMIDNVEFGRKGAEWLVEVLNGKGKIIMLNGIEGVDIERPFGAKEVFMKYPGIKILTEVSADWDYAKGKMAVENLLGAYPEIDGVWSSGGAMTRGAIEAFVEAGRPLVPMVGEDNNGYLKTWKEYKDQGYKGIGLSCPTYIYSYQVKIALEALMGLPIYKYVNIPVPTITEDTLDKYVRPDLPDSFWANTRLPDEEIRKIFPEEK